MSVKSVVLSAAVVLVAAGCQKSSSHDHGAPPPVAPPPAAAPVPAAPAVAPPANAVQAEMRALHEATRDWVTAIANNDLASIPPGISRVHSARMVTEQAVEAGAYRPPKESDNLEAFKQVDTAFHDELVKLLRASKANDLPAATKQLGVVLEGCTACHQRFRY